MDDNTQVQQPTDQVSDQPVVTDPAVSSMNDVAGMTPPPAPVMPDPAVDPLASMSDAAVVAPSMDAPTADASAPAEGADDYSYAEDVLNEILDSLDRIEAKLDGMEKKMG